MLKTKIRAENGNKCDWVKGGFLYTIMYWRSGVSLLVVLFDWRIM